MHAIAYGTVSSEVLMGSSLGLYASSHGLTVGVADSNLFRWEPSQAGLGRDNGEEKETWRTGYRPAPGRKFGRYRLIAQLGRGRQADVWQAERFHPTPGRVALKILNDPDRDPRRVAQLRREAERCTRMASPALLKVYEFGVEHGLAYMAMPLVIGCTLTAQAISQRRAETAGLRSSGSHRLAGMSEPRYTEEIREVLRWRGCVQWPMRMPRESCIAISSPATSSYPPIMRRACISATSGLVATSTSPHRFSFAMGQDHRSTWPRNAC